MRAVSFLLVRQHQVRRAVTMLIAGISLLDAVVIALYGPPQAAPIAFACFALTLASQRRIAGS